MKNILILLTTLSIAAGDINKFELVNIESGTSAEVIIVPNANPALIAFTYINYDETSHKQELSTLTGVDVTNTEWCAAFVNGVLDESNIPNNMDHKFPLTARGFLDWGHIVQVPIPGDLVIFPRGDSDWQGHVGFYLSTIIIDNVVYYHILGGNQSNKVSIVLYRASKALGIRRYTKVGINT